MKCKNCGFITHGKEIKCPYCGEKYDSEFFLDKEINILNWFYLSSRTLINIIGINLFLIGTIIDIFICNYLHEPYYYFPYIFLVIFGILILMNNLFLKSNKSNHIFLKLLLLSIVFSLMFGFVYHGEDIYHTSFNAWQILLGYYYPITLVMNSIINMISIMMKKKLDTLTMLLTNGALILCSILTFSLSFLPSLQLHQVDSARLMIGICYSILALIVFNSIVLIIMKLKCKVILS